jgi:hypothetical protein
MPADVIHQLVQLAKCMRREVAIPDEIREMLGLT